MHAPHNLYFHVARGLVAVMLIAVTATAQAADDPDKPKRGDEFLLFRDTKVELPGGDSRTFARGTRGRVIHVERTKVVAMLSGAKVDVPLDNIVAGRSGIARLSAAIREQPEDWVNYLYRSYLLIRLKEYDAAFKDASAVPTDAREYPYALMYRGLIHREREEWDEAIDEFTRAIDRSKSIGVDDAWRARMMVYRSGVYLRQEKFDAALADIDGAVKLGMEGAEIHVLRGRTLYRKGEADKAVEALRKAKEIDPDDEDVRWACVEVFEHMELYDAAVEELSAILGWSDRNPAALSARARLYIRLKRLDDATRDVDRALEIDENFPDALLNHGVLCEYRNDHRGLLEISPRLAKARITDASRLFMRARLLADAGMHEQAMSDVERAIAGKVRYAGPYELRARLFGYQQKWAQVLADASTAIELAPQSAYAYFLRGTARTGLREYELAVQDLDRAVQFNTDTTRADVFITRAQALSYLDRRKEAAADFRTALQLEPGNRTLVGRFVGLLQASEEYHEALIVLRQYSDHAGDHETIRQWRAGVWQRLGNYEMAIVECTEAIRLNPARGEYYGWRAMYYAFVGAPTLGLLDCDRGEALDPKNPLMPLTRGMIYYFGNRPAEAIASFRKALSLDDDNYAAHAGLAGCLASANDATLRSGEQSLTHALRACELTDWSDHQPMTALAAAYAELGRFSEAIEALSKALDLTPADRQAGLVEWLELFESGQPVRMHDRYEWPPVAPEP